MSNLKQFEQEIKKLKQRNENVEINKAGETSYTRRGILMLFTYLAVGVYLWAINIPRPWLNAIVPSVAFMLSTLTLSFFKRMWIKLTKQ